MKIIKRIIVTIGLGFTVASLLTSAIILLSIIFGKTQSIIVYEPYKGIAAMEFGTVMIGLGVSLIIIGKWLIMNYDSSPEQHVKGEESVTHEAEQADSPEPIDTEKLGEELETHPVRPKKKTEPGSLS